MRGKFGLALWLCACGVVLGGCGDGSGVEPPGAPPPTASAASEAPQQAPLASPSGGLEAAPALVLNDAQAERRAPPPPPFLPAFHQALRWSYDVGSVTTFRMFMPVGRAGSSLRVTFRAGDGSLTLQRATVAHADADGNLTSAPVPLTFSGAAGFTVAARTTATSDALAFPVQREDELAVSFEVKGSLAAAADNVNVFPHGTARGGAGATTQGALGGERFERAVGVFSIEVQGPPSRVFIAIGDSITEGYYDTYGDYRKVWTALSEAQLGVPVLNSGVSGQGFWDALKNLDKEVLSQQGVTDCIILLGTNDLGSDNGVTELEGRMTNMLNQLEPFCRPWVSTLLPKERTSQGDYAQVKSERLAFNAWIRQLPRATVIDLEAVLRQPNDPNLFKDGLTVDGIHPSPAGHQVMADEVVRRVREKWTP